MIRVFTLIALLGCLSVFSNAQLPGQRTFASFGYEDQTITGISGALTYYVRVKPYDDVSNSSIVLLVKPSQALNANTSFITCLVKDQPVLTQRITSPDSLLKLVLPLTKKYLTDDGRFIPLKIQARMSVSNDYCVDLDNPAVWLTVQDKSYLQTGSGQTANYQPSLRETLAGFDKVAIASAASLPDITAGGLIYTLLKQSNAKQKQIGIQVFGAQDSLDKTVVAGTLNQLPAAIARSLPPIGAGQGLVYLWKAANGNTDKNILVVTGSGAEGYRKAVYALLNPHLLNSSFTNQLLIDQVHTDSIAANRNLFTLHDLGANNELQEGAGVMRSFHRFSITDYDVFPKSLLLHLESIYAPVKAEDKGFINIYLNQNLVYTSLLTAKGEFKGDISLPVSYLSKQNTVVVEFRYQLGDKICKGSFNEFFSSVKTEASYISFSGKRVDNFPSFLDFPLSFRNDAVALVISPSFNSEGLKAIGELIYYLNPDNQGARFVMPDIYLSGQVTKDQLKNKNVIALLNKTDAFVHNYTDIPLQYNREFSIYRGQDGQQQYAARDFTNGAVAQLLKQDGHPVLLISSLGDSATASIESVIEKINGQLTNLESNVCIANGNSSYFFQISNGDSRLQYADDKNNIQVWWEKYRWFVLGFLLVVILLAFYFIRDKVKKSQDIFG